MRLPSIALVTLLSISACSTVQDAREPTPSPGEAPTLSTEKPASEKPSKPSPSKTPPSKSSPSKDKPSNEPSAKMKKPASKGSPKSKPRSPKSSPSKFRSKSSSTTAQNVNSCTRLKTLRDGRVFVKLEDGKGKAGSLKSKGTNLEMRLVFDPVIARELIELNSESLKSSDWGLRAVSRDGRFVKYSLKDNKSASFTKNGKRSGGLKTSIVKFENDEVSWVFTPGAGLSTGKLWSGELYFVTDSGTLKIPCQSE